MKSLEDEMAEALSAEIAAEIDFEIIVGLMVSIGWTQIKTLSDRYTPDIAYEMRTWTDRNVKGHYKCRGNTWVFEKEEDALLFSLRYA